MDNQKVELTKIAICDDEEMILEQLSQLIYNIMEKIEQKHEIYTFTEGNALLEKGDAFDLVFLDINMPDMDGIETGKRLQRKNPNCKIVMATGMVERFKETFTFGAFRFVTKPFEEVEIWEAIEAYLHHCIGNQVIEFYKNRTIVKVKQRDIHYVQAYGSYVTIFIKDMVCRKEISLNAIEQILDQRCFYRIHRKCIVNMFQITNYRNGKVHMGEVELEVSRRNRKEFEKAYMEFDLNYR